MNNQFNAIEIFEILIPTPKLSCLEWNETCVFHNEIDINRCYMCRQKHI